MGRLYDLLMKDSRLKEGLNACINCGTCTGICPAAEFYRYDPRRIVDIVQSKDEEEIEKLLKSDTIWYCGECMSCVTRCPRKNAPGLIIMALRSLSIDLGYFIESEKGRQQCPLVKELCANILDYGYCVYAAERPSLYTDHPAVVKHVNRLLRPAKWGRSHALVGGLHKRAVARLECCGQCNHAHDSAPP